jgi:hypothetical protein
MSIDKFERACTAASAEPSVTETASEDDWLMAVAEHLTVSPHPEQVDGALLGLFEAPGPVVGQNELQAWMWVQLCANVGGAGRHGWAHGQMYL